MKPFFSYLADTHRSKSPVSASRKRKLLLSYAPDWILTILLAAAFFSLDKVEGYKRQFSLEDTSLRHTYALKERVPNVALYLICFVTPLLLQPIINLLTIRSWWDLHNATLGLILGLAMTGSITQFVKITVGRPRPDIIDRCQPPAGSVDPPFGLSNVTICTQTDAAILRDGFRSFFSGHSSLSFAGLGFLAFYIAGKLHLFDKRGYAPKSWLALSPFAGASLVAISRTMDYRHHWHDVLVGSLVGTVIAYFAYRQYYPDLASELSHRPYSPRIGREDADSLPTHQYAPTAQHAQEHEEQLHGSSSTAYANPFAPAPIHGGGYGGNGAVGGAPYKEDYELEGTVLRPSPGPLDHVWQDGANAVSAPRSVPGGGRDSPRSSRPGSRAGAREIV